MNNYRVTGYQQGRRLEEDVKAANQSEARRIYEARNPGYKGGAAKNNGRV